MDLQPTYEQESNVSPAVMTVCGAYPSFPPGTKEFRRAMADLSDVEKFNIDLITVSNALSAEVSNTGKFKQELRQIVTTDSKQRRDGLCDLCKEAKRLASEPHNINVKYLNPLAFVLGYLAVVKKAIVDPKVDLTNPGAESKTKIETFNTSIRPLRQFVNRFADTLGFGEVTDIDILRYGRFWYSTGTQDVVKRGCGVILE